MNDDTTIISLEQPGSIIDPLTEIAREGARRMLMAALKAEAGLQRAVWDLRWEGAALIRDARLDYGQIDDIFSGRAKAPDGFVFSVVLSPAAVGAGPAPVPVCLPAP